eukprot:3884415-Karenia_brevis.AAC.1
MPGGLPGIGAKDSWYRTSVTVEHAKMFGVQLVGGVVDLFKCFDHVVRTLLYVLLLLSGFPRP